MNKNKQTALNVLAVSVGMLGLAYASVPLYDLFCRVTGFGGQTQVAEVLPNKTYDRKIKIIFSADVNPELSWDFKPSQDNISVKVGENALAFYKAKNIGGEAIIGTSTYNVTPIKAAKYFNKIECFCFQQQKLEVNEDIEFPVSFFIDPEIMQDEQLDDVDTITLSYTFFKYRE